MNPEVLEHPAFGQLEWDEKYGWYAGRLAIGPSRSIRVTLDPFTNIVPGHEPDHLDDPSAVAHSCADRVHATLAELDVLAGYAADKLLPVHNDGDWCDGKPIAKEQFVARMSLTSVGISQDGEAEICFDDGDLFWGHAIFVSTDTEGRPEHAELFG